MTLVIVIVGIIGAALTFWNGANWYGFVSGYRYNSEFKGKRYECRLRFATSECEHTPIEGQPGFVAIEIVAGIIQADSRCGQGTPPKWLPWYR